MPKSQVAGGCLLVLGGAASVVSLVLYLAFASIPRIQDELEPFQYWLLVGLTVVLAAVAALAFDVGKRLRAPSVAELLAGDPRPPVVYLRSFVADLDAALDEIVGDGRLTLPVATDEEALVEVLSAIGPVIAIGRPAEKLPLRGAARLYVSDDDWQQVVRGWLDRCALVVLRAGASDGLLWEFSRIIETVEPNRLVVLVPDTDRVYEAFCDKAAAFLPRPLPGRPSGSLEAGGLIGYLWFDEDWTPYFERIGRRAPGHRKFLAPAYAPLRGAFDPLIRGQLTKSAFTSSAAEVERQVSTALQARPPARVFVGRWMIYTLLGSVLAPVLLSLVPAHAEIPGLLISGIAGASLGIAQWYMLRKYLVNAMYWIHATVVAYLIADVSYQFAAGFLTQWPFPGPLLFSAVLGLLQWFILRSPARRSWIWIPATAIAWSLGGWAGSLAARAVDNAGLAYVVQLASAETVAGVIAGLITGPLLARMLGLARSRRAVCTANS